MKLIGIINFNNYFNRKIIFKDNLIDYLNDYECIILQTSFNFNPNDEVFTEVIVNTNDKCDYLLVIDETTNAIVSRWFVMEENRTRGGQIKMSLKRDVISDYYNAIATAPIYVQKAILPDTDPLVLIDEGVQLNKIKTEETLLRDNTKSAYLVGYISKNATPTDLSVALPSESFNDYITFSTLASAVGVSESTLANCLDFNKAYSNKVYFTNIITLRFYTEQMVENQARRYLNYFDLYANDNVVYRNRIDLFGEGASLYRSIRLYGFDEVAYKNAVNTNKTNLRNEIPTLTSRNYYLNSSQMQILSSYNGKIIKYLSKYYILNIVDNGVNNNVFFRRKVYSTDPVIKSICEDGNTPLSGGEMGAVVLNENEGYIEFEEVNDADIMPIVSTKISASRNGSDMNNFDLFVIPLNAKIIDSDEFSCNETVAKRMANAIGISLDANMYDLQLLPYFPIEEIESNGGIDITGLTEDEDFNYMEKSSYTSEYQLDIRGEQDFSVLEETGLNVWTFATSEGIDLPTGSTITNIRFYSDSHATLASSNYTIGADGKYYIDGTLNADQQDIDNIENDNWYFTVEYSAPATNIGIIFYPKKTSFQKVLNYSLSLKASMKVDSNCDMYRLVSPNYQGSFEFNVAKNGGTINNFIAYCTYKPYTPYIKVVPQFNYLYGTNYGDNRGLICGGDFSFPRISSAWENYQLNNKNYQNIFNRDIQHLDFEQDIERKTALISSIAGVVGDTSKGALAGGLVSGSPYGAIAGGLVAGVASGVGAAYDITILGKRQKEQRELAIDKYKLQLGNVKALPYTLTKVGVFDINSKIFPFIEYYTCTEEERNMFINKIKWESMTVGRIDYLPTFIKQDELQYFKGEVIRLDNLSSDNKVALAIYEELLKGVYV